LTKEIFNIFLGEFMKKLFYICLLTTFVFLGIYDVKAQEEKLPVDALGFGATVSYFRQYGIHGGYALSPNLHIGSKLGFYYDGGTKTIPDEFLLTVEPYAKYFFKNIKYLNPFLQASFAASTFKENYYNQNIVDSRKKTTTSFMLYAGGEWFPYKGVGVMAGVQLFKFDITESILNVGIGETFLGLEFFL
jgi:hypothetical protein